MFFFKEIRKFVINCTYMIEKEKNYIFDSVENKGAIYDFM